jgi:hypothetical protein
MTGPAAGDEGSPTTPIQAKKHCRWAGAVLAALALTGCVDSAAPILTDAKPLLGPKVRMHVYTLVGGQASGPEIGTFRWDGTQYRVVGRPNLEVAAFTVFALAGKDFIVQSQSSRSQVKGIEYAIARTQADGAYLVAGIDEDDADDAARAKHCTKNRASSCRIADRDALMAFAQATAAKPDFKGALALIVEGHGPK